ncbi:transposable element Tcb1 transposase [Trichonephila clavipes]|nr:transposable element Tcb1 transposase [Trichonephila clavipes]
MNITNFIFLGCNVDLPPRGAAWLSCRCIDLKENTCKTTTNCTVHAYECSQCFKRLIVVRRTTTMKKRRRHECQVPVTTIERHRYGGAGWLVWGSNILGSRFDLHVQSVTMTGHICRDVILEQHVRLFRGAMGAEFLYMDDSARPHRANIVDEWLQSDDITRIDWPEYSPDLNSIEHVCDVLGRRIAARQTPPTNLPELWRTLLDE